MDAPSFLPVTADNVDEAYETIFAPWVKAQGHEIVTVEEGRVVTRLPQDPEQHHFGGVFCGQALMSAIDTAISIAVQTLPVGPRGGTTHQTTQFLRRADGAVLVEANVLKAGRRSWYGEVHVRDEATGDLVAHATSEFR